MEQKDYYQILGLQENTGQQQIKDNYRDLAFQYHPDRNQTGSDAVEKMKSINEAYAVLSNPEKRREYDALRHRYGSSAYSQFRQSYSEQDIFRGSDVHHVFEEMAKSFGIRGFEDLFREFYGQKYQTFQFSRPGFFAKGFFFSGGSGKGIQNRHRVPLSGNLGRFSRYLLGRFGGVELPENGGDINEFIYLYPELAQQGGPYAYDLKKKSKKLIIRIPPGTREGQQIRLAGMGEDGKGGGRSGDLYLKVKIRKSLFRSIKGLLGFFRSQ